ncbi:MAG: aldo/keto reductase [Gemmatimonadota bacterium]
MIERVALGRSGLVVSRLCFGTGTNGWNGRSNQGDLGVERLARLLRHAHERGVTFWDTADQYGTHPHVAAALSEVDRASVTVATKTVARTAAEATAAIERFRRELGTDYLDILLLHCMTDAEWPQQLVGVMDALSRAKERGLVRAVGVSCHDFGALTASATCDWVDVNLVRLNGTGASMCASPERVVPLIRQMAEAGKGVYGMKALGGGGELTADPAHAIAYTGGVEGVHALVVGMMSEAQIDQNAALVSAVPRP